MGQRGELGVNRPVLVTALVGIVSLTAGLTRDVLDLPVVTVEIFSELLLAVLVVGAVTSMHAWRDVGFRRLATSRDLRFFWIPLVPVLPALPAAVSAIGGQSLMDVAGQWCLWLLRASLVAFDEEVDFRGLLLRFLVPRGLWLAALVSSLLFGLFHVVNLAWGADLGRHWSRWATRRPWASPLPRSRCAPAPSGLSW